MNKYQEALKEITHLTFVETKYYEMLKKLAEEKDEQKSRKDKLVVGSEWECVVNTFAPIRAFYIDPLLDKNYLKIGKSAVVRVVDFDDMNVLMILNSAKCILSKDQFLLCFKPR